MGPEGREQFIANLKGEGVYEYKKTEANPEVAQPKPVEELAAAKLDFSNEVVNFELNSVVPDPGLIKKVETIATKLKAHPNVKVEIIGYADQSGTETHNHKVSRSRATAIRDLLVNKFGIESNRLKIVAKGETEGKSHTDPASRRVEVKQVN